MYESPITQILSEMQTVYEDECLKAVQRVGFDVNKEELAKALVYDRGQYEKGYADAIEEFAERMQEKVESFQAEINGFKADVLTLDYFAEFVDEIASQMKGEKE